jgi:hypothetical protein
VGGNGFNLKHNYLRSLYVYLPSSVEMRSQVKVCGHLITAIAGSKPTEVTDVRSSVGLVMCYVGSGLCIKLITRSRGGGHAVARLVEALQYKPKGRGFDSKWCHWNFSLT